MKLRDAADVITVGFFNGIEMVDASVHFDTVTALPSRRWQIKDTEGNMSLNEILDHGFAADEERERYKDMELLEFKITHVRKDRVTVAIALRNS
ncbi:MAG: hypothetical protein ACOX41_02245 [Anaerovoracaceae bacterium]|jgi:hypothetical protein